MRAPKRGPAELASLNVRLRESLRGQLEQAAKNNGRSMNSELCYRLALSLAKTEVERRLIAADFGEARGEIMGPEDVAIELREMRLEVKRLRGRLEALTDAPSAGL